MSAPRNRLGTRSRNGRELMHRHAPFRFILTAAAVVACGLQSSRAATFQPATFQEPDGAITLHAGGKFGFIVSP
jgi:hypothetical protein